METAAAKIKRAPRAKKTDGDFAVFATGGKQYLVSVGDRIKIEKIKGLSTSSGRTEYQVGDSLNFDTVLLIGSSAGLNFGSPFIKGSYITAKLTKIARNKTIDVIKYKQKSRYFKKYGHRQPYYEVAIESIK